MLNDNAKLLVAALRSGEYTQTCFALHRTKRSYNGPIGYCCLEVACEVFAKAGNKLDRIIKVDFEVFSVPGQPPHSSVLPPVVARWFGFSGACGSFRAAGGATDSLTGHNDNGDTFEEIADLIESEPKGLFV